MQIGIGHLDRGLRLGISWGLGLKIGVWDLGLRIWILDWVRRLGLGITIGNWNKNWEWNWKLRLRIEN